MIGALLLAGGEGRRMGGVDKGMQLLAGRPLYHHVLQRLQPQVGWLGISANRHLPQYATSGCAVWPDDPSWQGMGPLAALASCRSRLPVSLRYLQIAPCDTPLLPRDLVATLAAALGEADVALPLTASGPQPACMLLRVSALGDVAEYLAAGGRSIRGWLARHPLVEVGLPAEGFVNANHLHDLQQLSVQLARRGE